MMGQYPTPILVTDPTIVAMLKGAAQNNGISPGTVDQLIAQGNDAVQIALAVTRAPFGPAQLASQTEATNALVDQNQKLLNQVMGISPVDSTSGVPAPSLMDWISANWPWLAIGGVGALIVLRKL